jgi:hypothetical protein
MSFAGMEPGDRSHLRKRTMTIQLRRLAAVCIGALLAGAPLHAQRSSTGQGGGLRVRSAALARGRHVVVVDLDANRLYFTKGSRVLWSAPVGTGTGLRLASGRGTWDFQTPRGAFHVVYKEREPDWIAPDWYFIEHDLPVPSPDHPSRRQQRGLGSAAVFFGQGLAIHGTDKPHLLGQRVSHGCIRLSNADALRLYHNVQVGTEVVIVQGGSGSHPPEAVTPAAPSRRAAGTPPPRDSVIVALESEDTDALIEQMEYALADDPRAEARPRWTDIASVLLLRGALNDDDAALAGLFAAAGTLEPGRTQDEMSTFVVDAFVQAPIRVLGVLGQTDRQTRQRVATVLAETSVALYPGEAGDRQLPWPTRRVPRETLSSFGRRAWDAVAAAEAGLRPAPELAAGGR